MQIFRKLHDVCKKTGEVPDEVVPFLQATLERFCSFSALSDVQRLMESIAEVALWTVRQTGNVDEQRELFRITMIVSRLQGYGLFMCRDV